MLKLNVTGSYQGLTHSQSNRGFLCAQEGFRVLETAAFLHWFEAQEFTQLPDVYRRLTIHELALTLEQKSFFTYRVITRPWYKRYSAVIGYTQNGVIHTYSNSFDAMSDAELSGHIVHEWTHFIGHSHSMKVDSVALRSAPYMIGEYVENALR
jgi:hypothetical protein